MDNIIRVFIFMGCLFSMGAYYPLLIMRPCPAPDPLLIRRGVSCAGVFRNMQTHGQGVSKGGALGAPALSPPLSSDCEPLLT